MTDESRQSLNVTESNRGKGKDILAVLTKKIEKGFGSTIDSPLKKPEEKRYFIGLKYLTTTNKAICEVLNIPVEAGTRYKRNFEKQGILVSSENVLRCPVTRDEAHYLSTNPEEFDRLRPKRSTQLNLFDQ